MNSFRVLSIYHYFSLLVTLVWAFGQLFFSCPAPAQTLKGNKEQVVEAGGVSPSPLVRDQALYPGKHVELYYLKRSWTRVRIPPGPQNILAEAEKLIE